LERLVDDLDRRIKRGHDRLDHQEDKSEMPLTGESAQKINLVSEKLQKLLKQIEDLGEEGKVDESQQLMKVVDQLKAEKEQLSIDSRSISQQEKRMKVCEICGAFLVVGDTDKRISSHLDGKQHQGYAQIRKAIHDYRSTHADERKPSRETNYDREERVDRERDSRYSEREPKDRSRGGEKRGHSRDYDKEYSNRDRDRKRGRSEY